MCVIYISSDCTVFVVLVFVVLDVIQLAIVYTTCGGYTMMDRYCIRRQFHDHSMIMNIDIHGVLYLVYVVYPLGGEHIPE